MRLIQCLRNCQWRGHHSVMGLCDPVLFASSPETLPNVKLLWKTIIDFPRLHNEHGLQGVKWEHIDSADVWLWWGLSILLKYTVKMHHLKKKNLLLRELQTYFTTCGIFPLKFFACTVCMIQSYYFVASHSFLSLYVGLVAEKISDQRWLIHLFISY